MHSNVDLRTARLKAGAAAAFRAALLAAALSAFSNQLGAQSADPAAEPADPEAAEAAAAEPAEPAEPAADDPADPEAIRGVAREAQARFERLRIAHLPWAWSLSRGPCDERVGRFCFWHDRGGATWEPPPEPTAVTDAREALLAALEEAAARLPDDAWVAGQRVRYEVEAGRADRAAALARESRAERWWRAALEGYALHAAGDYARAEAAFDAALAAMPVEERDRWTDPSLLLGAPARRLYGDLAPGARRAFERRLWWLADPLWTVPGNERRSEHFARHVLDRVHEDARSAYDVKWGHDLRELLLRYGWPVGFERVRRSAASLAGDPGTRIVAHDPPGGRRFVPDREAIAAPTVVGTDAWSVERETPRETYAPAYARRFVDLEAQVAAFRRGERVVVVAAWALDPDSLAPDAAVVAGIAVSSGPDRAPEVERERTREPRGSLSLEVAARPAVISVEVLAPEARTAGRARTALTVPDRASDVLVLTRVEPPPRSLEDAVAAARPDLRFAPGERVGLYLELYPPRGAPWARVEVGVREVGGGGFWRALGGALGLAGERSTASLAWTEPLDGAAVRPLPMTLALPAVPEGEYAVEVEVDWPDGRRSVALRRIRVER